MEENIHHDSARRHLTGESVYINDMEAGGTLLHGLVVYSTHPHARILEIDLSAAKKVPGVHTILTAPDIPGLNQMGPVIHDEPCLADGEVLFIGQALALIAATSTETARKAASLVQVQYEPLEAILDLDTAMKKNNLLCPERFIESGNAEDALEKAPHRIRGELRTGAQEHWYLETQSALAVPGEGNEITVYASSQNPTETQAIVAEVLGIAFNEVEVEVRRIGGGFGGKETQGNHVAAWAALLSGATRQPVKIHLFRDDDQLMTGKRHPFHSFYEAGFDDDGRLLAYSIILNADAGYATDLSRAILERAMLHAENAYYIPDVRIVGRLWKTNNPSNTAFRGFGGPQGMAVIEQVIDRVARYLGKDAAEIREMNFYAEGTRNITPYGAVITQHRIKDAFSRLMQTSGYRERRREVDAYNREHEFTKKGLSSTPVKFGISFTTSFLNQAGALVNIYTDGTIQVNHGGTEMGQGLHAKILHVAAAELGISPKFIRITNTNTSKVPNTSPTAASSGSDLNGMAVKQAVTVLKERLAEVAAGEFNRRMPDSGCKAEQVIFANNLVSIHGKEGCSISFHELAALARMKQVSLSATGYYKTPGIWFDRDKGKGDPFYYYAYGVSVSEVIVNTLTGQHMVLRTDILQDAGDSLNEGIDTGQVEGGFVQGLGWCTTEEMKWNSEGFQLTHSPDTYKIPTVNDIPEDFRVNLMKNVPNDGTIRGSKAVGEPPFMLAFSVWLAIKDAISAVGDHRIEPEFSLPATAEVILLSAEKIRKAVKAGG